MFAAARSDRQGASMKRPSPRFRILFLLSLTIALCSLLFSSLVTAQQDASRPPVTMPQDLGSSPGHLPRAHYVPSRAPEMTYPLWLDSSMILSADGTINTALVHPQVAREIKAILALPPKNGCIPVGPYFHDTINPPPRATLEQATHSSLLVLLGKVTEKAYGFLGETPGQLLRVVPEEVIKGWPRDVAAYFVFLPVGTFKLGDLTICKTDSRQPDPPAVGEQVLILASEEPGWQQDREEPYLDLEDEGGLVTIHSGGAVSLPKRYRTPSASSAPRGQDDVLARVRASLQLPRALGTDPVWQSIGELGDW
jgi:hypothetical protein